MIVDDLRSEPDGHRVTRSARFCWARGEFRLELTMPAEFAPGRADASPFLCIALLLAMRLGEHVDVRGPVSPPLLEHAPAIVDVYSSWDRSLFRTRVRAGEVLDPAPRADGTACFLSRGVDSLYSATTPREDRPEITHFVFCDRLEPMHSEGVRAEELRIAGEVAERLGRPLVPIETNIRDLTTPIVHNWEDMVGAALAFFGTAMSGGFGHVVIPSSDGPETVGPCGTSQLLDPLFSTAEVQVEYDTPGTRTDKVAWLARERPDLLPYLKVCFFEDRVDNCGRCSKCLLTMLALEAAGALDRASAFPSELDPQALGELRIRGSQPEEEYRQVERALRAGGKEDLAAHVASAQERAAAATVDARVPADSPNFRKRFDMRTRRERAMPFGAPRTTVMMPCYEAETTLRGAVDSVLSQTLGELEQVVVDDGSTVAVADVLEDIDDPRLRIIRHARNRGLSAARNTALAAARTPLVSQLDADDLWEPGYLEAVLPRLDDPEVGLVYANCTILGHPTGHEDYIGDPSVHPIDSFPKIAEQNPVPCPTVTMRADAARAVGGYATWLRQCEDYHLYMKLAQAGWRFAYVHERLARYRWPEPARGMSFDARRHEAWEHAMFASFAIRHPRTPGPRRQTRVRVRRELDRVRKAAGRRLPQPAGGRPRLLVEPGSYAMLNLGDIAMLQVCVERLRELWPQASIGVLTESPARLAEHCPGVKPVPVVGQHEWFESRWGGGDFWPLLAEPRRGSVENLAERLGDRNPHAARAALRAELLAREPASEELRSFVGWLLGADGLVVSGRGGTTDVFLDDGLEVLRVLRTAIGLGIPTAMFSQGLGPMDDERLRALARQVLPRLDVLCVRERRAALPLLEGLGVAAERVLVGGDDALEPAHRLSPNGASRDAIGLGLRRSAYSGMTDETARTVGRVVKEAAARHGSELRLVPVSLYPGEADARSFADVTGRDGDEATTPAQAMRQAGGCRVVVAGSYHAAVFALAQGVPVVALSAAPYYDAKLAGLADLFPGGCRVLSAQDDELGSRLAAALDESWEAAGLLAPELEAAAERQIAASREAYARFSGPVARRVGASAPLTRRTP
jgi:colanic acid/amylovoran biosynthesis protein